MLETILSSTATVIVENANGRLPILRNSRFCVPRWPCEQGAWLVTWWSRVRGWAAAAYRLLAGRPWASRTTGEVHTCSDQLSLLPIGRQMSTGLS